MPESNIKTLYTFTVLSDRLVDETTSRDEPDPSNPDVVKTVSETRKVNKPVPTYFAFKRPSRSERELAEEERAVWWSKYIDMGIAPEAQLLKRYANMGGILAEDDRKAYTEDRVALEAKMEELYILKSMKDVNQSEVSRLTGEMIDLRDKIIRFEREQSTFFENTAEAKSRVKLCDYLVLHLSYVRDSEDKPWVPYFKGATTADKAAEMERLDETEDLIYREARLQLYFLASFLRDSDYRATTADIDEFLKQANRNG